MKNTILYFLPFCCMICLGFGKIFQGMSMQMTIDGIGIYYKQLLPLLDNAQFTGDAGFHFDKSQQRIDMFGYDNNYQHTMFDITIGYRNELFWQHIAGPFRPILIMGTGGISDVKSFSNNNILGIWMIKYVLGFGFQFYKGNIINEISVLFIHSEAIEGNVAFQLAFYL